MDRCTLPEKRKEPEKLRRWLSEDLERLNHLSKRSCESHYFAVHPLGHTGCGHFIFCVTLFPHSDRPIQIEILHLFIILRSRCARDRSSPRSSPPLCIKSRSSCVFTTTQLASTDIVFDSRKDVELHASVAATYTMDLELQSRRITVLSLSRERGQLCKLCPYTRNATPSSPSSVWNAASQLPEQAAHGLEYAEPI